MSRKNIKKVLMAGKKWSKFEYSQQNEENKIRKKKKGGKRRDGGVYLEDLSSEKPGESGCRNIINSDKLTSLIMKLMEVGIACLWAFIQRFQMF